MRLGGEAKYLAEVTTEEDILEAVNWAFKNNQKTMMIGHGSNIIWTDKGFDGLILVNEIEGFNIESSGDNALATICAGEVWDQTVEKLVEDGWSGVEQLSLIPGAVGATPVQNVGAYGKELADVLESVRAYDIEKQNFETIPASECNFSYRKSRFNTTDKNKFFIVSIKIKLTKTPPAPPFYAALEKYLDENNITVYTPRSIRSAVIAIRNSKLPNPAEVANCGSFFKNPIVDGVALEKLTLNYPNIPKWEMKDGNYKISAAWLLDQLGLKGFHDDQTGMSLWKYQPLVFVNESAKNTTDLLDFKQKIIDMVQKKFAVTLIQEPELI